MIRRIDHVTVAVHDVRKAAGVYTEILGIPGSGPEESAISGVAVVDFRLGNTALEVCQPVNTDGAVAKFLQRRSEGLYLLSLQVTDLKAAVARLRGAGVTLLGTDVALDQEARQRAYIHPKSASGVLIQLIEGSSGTQANGTALHHVLIAVRDLDAAGQQYAGLLASQPSAVQELPSMGTKNVKFTLENSIIELCQPLTETHPLARFLQDRGEGMYLLSLRLPDFERKIAMLRKRGFSILGDERTPVMKDVRLVYVHPKSAHGVLIQIAA